MSKVSKLNLSSKTENLWIKKQCLVKKYAAKKRNTLDCVWYIKKRGTTDKYFLFSKSFESVIDHLNANFL